MRKLNERSGGVFTQFLVENSLCPDCLVDLNERYSSVDGGWVLVCPSCGFNPPKISYAATVPMGEDPQPTSFIADGKNLGNTLQIKGEFCVLSHGINARALQVQYRFASLLDC